MSNVIKFDASKPREGEFAFMQCPCGPESFFMPVVIADHHSPIITGILCPNCETHHDVINGIVQLGESDK